MIAAALLYDIPAPDMPEFLMLPENVRDEIRLTLSILKGVACAKSVNAGCKEHARPFMRGFSAGSLARKFKNYKDSGGDWRVVMDKAKAKRDAEDVGLCGPFRDHLQSLYDKNHRKYKPAIRKLYRQWRAGEEIPGYGTWRDWWIMKTDRPLPQACPPDLPRGWGYRNLTRQKPTRIERILTQRGVAAARTALPPIIGTREGMRFMEWVVLDDWRSDFRVMAGIPRPCQLNGILALDVSCGYAMRFGIRPDLPTERGTRENLCRSDTKAIIAGILSTYGYPTEYVCNIIVERGTATISEADAAAISELTAQATGGQVKIHWTSMISGNVFGFADRPLGNFLGKAWLESYFNLVHNEMAEVPGQIGARYALAPGELHGRMKQAEAIEKAGLFLPPELRRDVKTPFKSTHEARTSLEHMFRRLNHRTEHSLEAFEDVLEWREQALDPWRPSHETIGMSQGAIDRLLWRTRQESPVERYGRLSDGVTFKRIHPSVVQRFMEAHRLVTIEKPGEIAFKIGKTNHVFQDRRAEQLQADSEFLAYYDTNDLRWVHLTDGQGAYVCSVPEVKAVTRDDHEAVSQAIAQKNAQLKRITTKVQKRNGPRMRKALADAEHNARLLNTGEAVNLLEGGAVEVADAPALVQQIAAVAVAEREVADGKARLLDVNVTGEDIAAAMDEGVGRDDSESFSNEYISDLLADENNKGGDDGNGTDGYESE